MKKILYSVLILAATALVACEEADNGSSSDSAPNVTFYNSWNPSEAFDSDVDCPLRIISNSVTEQLYALAEPISDKQAFVAANGAEAYIQRVIDQGKLFESTSVEYIFRGLKGDYAITAVALSGSDRTAVEYIFNGIVWIPAGKAVGVTNIIQYVVAGGNPQNPNDVKPCAGEVELFRKTNANDFYIANFFDQVGMGLYEQEFDQRLYFSFDADNRLVDFKPEAVQGDKLIFCGNMPYAGYWDPVKYGDYCKFASDLSKNIHQVMMLVSETGTTNLYINNIIQLDMTNAIWYTAQ